MTQPTPTEESGTHSLSPLAAELMRFLDHIPGNRVSTEDLLNAAAAFAPGLVGSPDGRSRFRQAIDELHTAGTITLPAPRSRTGWDSRALPPIPNWITRVHPAPTQRPRPIKRVWPRALEAAGHIATRADEQKILERIAAWMRDDPTPAPVPIQERSLELFDDEKAIDGYLKNRLFTSGALTLELLACFIPPLPFVAQYLPGAGTTGILVLENLASYTSFLTALRELPPSGRPDLHLGWGGGNAFTHSILSIPTLDPAPTTAHYFGDVDLAGLLTAVNAAGQARAAGLPALRPATSCYQYLLSGPISWRMKDISNQRAAADYDNLCRWLGPPLSQQAHELLSARERIPQERLGLNALRQHPELWEKLTNTSE